MKRLWYFSIFVFVIPIILQGVTEKWIVSPSITIKDVTIQAKGALTDDWTEIVLKNSNGYIGNYGDPKIPVFRKIYYLPKGSHVEAKVISIKLKESKKTNFELVPWLKSPVKIKGAVSEFKYNEESYKTVFPQFDVKVNKKGIVRGMEVWEVVACPVKYIDNTVYVYDMEIEINKEEGVYDNRLYSKAFDNFYREDGIKGVLPLPMKILFICPNAYRDTLQRYADWKWEMGYDVVVATEDSISNWTFDGIKAYIQDAYDNWTVPPTFVILVGDAADVPTDTVTVDGETFNSDLGYYLLDGTDFYPDVYGGRISVEVAGELGVVIDKLLTYERGTFTTGNWMTNAQFIASSDPSGYIVSERTHNYVIDTLSLANDYGFTCYKVYPKTNGGDEQDIANNINSGVLYNIYSGHGDWPGYYDYDIVFTTDSVNILLHNNDMLPFCATHACLTHDFDATGGVCGGEGWLRKPNGGAFTSWGATIYTYWDEDDTLERAWFRSCFYDSNWVIGQFTQDGLHAVDNSGSSLNDYYFYEYHILGDPSIMLRSKRVDTLSVSVPSNYTYPSGSIDITVKDNDGITPIANALVCIYTRYGDHYSTYTNTSGVATLNYTVSSPETLFVTVTAHDYMYYEGYSLPQSGAPNVPVVMYPMNDAWLASSNINMRFYSTDDEGDSISYRIYWSQTPDFAIVDTENVPGLYASGDTVFYLSSHSFTNGPWYYSVQCIDPLGDSLWSAKSGVRIITINDAIGAEGWYEGVSSQFNDDVLYQSEIEGDSIVANPYNGNTLLPFTSFESTTDYSVVDGGGDNSWSSYTSPVEDGTYSVGIKYSYSNENDWLIINTPYEVKDGDSLFFYQYGNWVSYRVYHGLWYSETGVDTSSFIELNGVLPDAPEDAWGECRVDISSLAGKTVYFAFKYQGYNADDWYIDDIQIISPVIVDSCYVVSNSINRSDFFTPPDNYKLAVLYKSTPYDSIAFMLEGFDGSSWQVVAGPIYDNTSDELLLNLDSVDVNTYSTVRLKAVMYPYESKSSLYPVIKGWGIDPSGNLFIENEEIVINHIDANYVSILSDGERLRLIYNVGPVSQKVKIDIFDISGRKVYSSDFNIRSKGSIIFSPDIRKGVYFYKISSDNKDIDKGKFVLFK